MIYRRSKVVPNTPLNKKEVQQSFDVYINPSMKVGGYWRIRLKGLARRFMIILKRLVQLEIMR